MTVGAISCDSCHAQGKETLCASTGRFSSVARDKANREGWAYKKVRRYTFSDVCPDCLASGIYLQVLRP